MHMDTSVIKVADFKSDLRSYDLHYCLEHMASHKFILVIEVIEHHMSISHRPCRRRSIGPLPSCFVARHPV